MINYKRGKRKIIADYKSQDFYAYYKQKYGEKALPYKKFTAIWDDFIDIRMQLVIYNNLEFHMPNRFGSISVNIAGEAVQLKKNGEVRTIPNWAESKKLWEKMYPGKTAKEIKNIKDKPIVYYTNDATNGKVLKFVWDRSSCNFKHHTHYTLSMVRKWKVKLAEYVTTTKTAHYYERVTWKKKLSDS